MYYKKNDFKKREILTCVAWMMVKSLILLKPAPIFDLKPGEEI